MQRDREGGLARSAPGNNGNTCGEANSSSSSSNSNHFKRRASTVIGSFRRGRELSLSIGSRGRDLARDSSGDASKKAETEEVSTPQQPVSDGAPAGASVHSHNNNNNNNISDISNSNSNHDDSSSSKSGVNVPTKRKNSGALVAGNRMERLREDLEAELRLRTDAESSARDLECQLVELKKQYYKLKKLQLVRCESKQSSDQTTTGGRRIEKLREKEKQLREDNMLLSKELRFWEEENASAKAQIEAMEQSVSAQRELIILYAKQIKQATGVDTGMEKVLANLSITPGRDFIPSEGDQQLGHGEDRGEEDLEGRGAGKRQNLLREINYEKLYRERERQAKEDAKRMNVRVLTEVTRTVEEKGVTKERKKKVVEELGSKREEREKEKKEKEEARKKKWNVMEEITKLRKEKQRGKGGGGGSEQNETNSSSEDDAESDPDEGESKRKGNWERERERKKEGGGGDNESRGDCNSKRERDFGEERLK